MSKPSRVRKLLSSSAKVATLVVLGAAETACNLQIQPIDRDASPRAELDAGVDAGAMDAGEMDAGEVDAGPEADAGDGDAGVTSDGAPDVDGAADPDASLVDGG